MTPEHLEAIKAALQDNSFCFLPDFQPSDQLPNWSEIINALNQAAHTKADFHINDPFVETQINHVIRRGVGYFYGFFNNSDVHVNPKLAQTIQTLNDNGLPFFGNSIFLNLFTEDDYARPHNDDWSHNIYIQCEGSTTWRFHQDEDPDNVLDTITLEPGDAVFFTGDTYHSVSADTPRASIVLRLDRKTL